MNHDFDKSLMITMQLEGKDTLNLNPKDPGNWTGGKCGKGILKGTKFGIAASSHPHLDIKNLQLDYVKEIYKREYWDAAKCFNYAWPLCAAVFDFSVQSGPRLALKFLNQNPEYESFLNARDNFLKKWSKSHPGNRGVEMRVARLKKLINSY